MKAFYIAQKTLRELWREPLLLGLLLAFPLILLGFYYVAFGETDEGLAKHLNLWVHNQDNGAATPDGETWRIGQQLVDLLAGVEFEGKPIFSIKEIDDPHDAEIALREHKAALLLTLPPSFSADWLAALQEKAAPAELRLTGDPYSSNYTFARSLLDQLLREFVNETLDWQDENLTIDYAYVSGTGAMSDFDFGVPGLIVFSLMLLVTSTAQILVREHVNGALRRLRLTRLSAASLLLGVTLAQMALSLFLVPFTFGVALLLGFDSHGSLLLAMGIGLLLTLSVVGLGLIVACFAHSDSEAANLGATAGALLTLLSGAMYPMPDVPLAVIAGRSIQIYDLLPTAHAAEAMRRVLILGEGVVAVSYELAALSVLSALLLAVGVILYAKLQLRKI